MNNEKVKLLQDNMIQIPEHIIKQMQVTQGGEINILFTTPGLAQQCLVVDGESDLSIDGQEYFCIPVNVLKSAGLLDEDVQVILEDEKVIITTSNKVIEDLPREWKEVLQEQEIDIDILVDNVVEKMNEYSRR